MNIGSETKVFFVKLILIILLFGVTAGGVYRINYKLKHKKFRCYVREIKWETRDTFTIRLKTSERLNFKPGQFCFLRINKDKLYARHPFTISSAPNEDTLDFTMKIRGKFTKIAKELKKGEEVIVDGPFGIFVIEDKDRTKDLVFIAGGVGITPFMSMIKNNLDSSRPQNITLIYSSKTKEDIIFKRELDRIRKRWFRRIYVLSKEEKSSESWLRGHVDGKIIKNNVDNFNDSLFYICGPEPMKDRVFRILKEMGVKKQNVKIESFFW
ncbi:MAG: FAD-dependent oxidoreductase [Candidatus Pacearchaeota archaeon]